MVQAKNATACGERKALAALLVVLLLPLTLAPFLTGCAHEQIRKIVPPPPITLACATSPETLFPGDPITVTAVSGGSDPAKTPIYSWRTSGGTIHGQIGPTVTIDTTNLAAGNYTVNGKVATGPRPGETATCSTSFTVKQFEPPTISCVSTPSSMHPGAPATITAIALSPQNRPLRYSYAATAGSITGSGNTATLSTIGAPAGLITVACNVVDDKGLTASTTTRVALLAPAAPPRAGLPFQVQCLATPTQVRPGDPVTLDLLPGASPGDVVEWHTSAGVLDAGTSTNVIDTAGLTAGTVNVSAEVTRGSQVAKCSSAFTVDPKAPVTPWPFLDIVRIERKPGTPEAAGYALYTYLLYRQKPNPSDKDNFARFRNILAAIEQHNSPEQFGQPSQDQQPSTAPVSQTSVDKPVPRRELALIVVPVDSDVPFTVDELAQHYNTALAAQLLSGLKCQRTTDRTNCIKLFAGDGPYLISSTVRITAQPRGFLMQNLDNTTPDVAGQWVSAYMTMVSQEHNWSGGYTLDQARLDFFKQLDIAGGDLPKAKVAVIAAIQWFNFK